MRIGQFFKARLWAGVAMACISCMPPHAMRPDSTRSDGWSSTALKNATYTGFTVTSDSVSLVGGRWEGPPYVDRGAARPSITFVADLYRIGGVGSRGGEGAVVFLAESSGGSGTFLYLAVVEAQRGRLINTATAPVGDRVQIRDLRIENGTIAVDVLQAGPQDAACCPGELATRRWRWIGDRLAEAAAPEDVERLSMDVLGGVTWKLSAWDADEAAPDSPSITLAYAGGRLAGSAGCNRYSATVTIGESPGAIGVGKSGATRMACPESVMDAERRFLKQLGGVRKFAFLAGQLGLTYEMDGKLGTMRFARTSTPR